MSPSKRGLHDRLNRVSHWDVNVTDLERSKAWYEATTALRVVAPTYASQDFPGLGIQGGSFKGYMMRDATQAVGSPMIHLVQWTTPHPVGKPYLSHTNVGWFRIVPVAKSGDEARKTVVAQGSEPFTPTTNAAVCLSPSLPELDYRVFTVHDPDGISVEFSGKDIQPNFTAVVPYTVAHNTANVDKHIPFYLNVLGLDFLAAVQSQSKIPNVYSPGGGLTGLSGAFFGIRGNASYVFDWLQWNESHENPTPYDEPNHVGIIRCAIEVDDIYAAHATLDELSRSPEYHFIVAKPETWDFGSDFGVRKVLNFQDPEGVGFQLIEQPKLQPSLHPWGRGAQFI
ncbi:uncharacterized protein NECHADRAFT_87870 [Neofusicoccum parvum]|nr:uncharacterized protein NECHADRAFT_87870 [Neofusicoccum parvum]